MIRIGICDDENRVALQLKNIIENILIEKNIAHSISIYLSGIELLQQIEEIDVLFLDIEMPEMDGIQVGKKVKLQNPDCKIIMATGMIERFKEAFHIQAFRFITKPFDEKEVRESLDAITKEQYGNQEIEVYLNRSPFYIRQFEISFIRAFNGYVEIMIRGKWFRKESSLQQLKEELDQRLFCQISRQYMVNLGQIDCFQKGIVTMGENDLKISRRCRKEFERRFIEYDIHRGEYR